MQMIDPLLVPTKLLDFDAAPLAHLIGNRSWRGLSEHDRIGAAYDFVRNEIAFGYNRADDIPASEVLSDGYGQCNTKRDNFPRGYLLGLAITFDGRHISF